MFLKPQDFQVISGRSRDTRGTAFVPHSWTEPGIVPGWDGARVLKGLDNRLNAHPGSLPVNLRAHPGSLPPFLRGHPSGKQLAGALSGAAPAMLPWAGDPSAPVSPTVWAGMYLSATAQSFPDVVATFWNNCMQTMAGGLWQMNDQAYNGYYQQYAAQAEQMAQAEITALAQQQQAAADAAVQQAQQAAAAAAAAAASQATSQQQAQAAANAAQAAAVAQQAIQAAQATSAAVVAPIVTQPVAQPSPALSPMPQSYTPVSSSTSSPAPANNVPMTNISPPIATMSVSPPPPTSTPVAPSTAQLVYTPATDSGSGDGGSVGTGGIVQMGTDPATGQPYVSAAGTASSSTLVYAGLALAAFLLLRK